MAKESPAPAQNPAEADALKNAKKSTSVMKLVKIGVPIFVVQAIVVYFLTAKFILPTRPHDETGKK